MLVYETSQTTYVGLSLTQAGESEGPKRRTREGGVNGS
jgi:hypothetical protein